MNKVLLRPFYDYEKEEKWLNQKAKEGWALTWYCWMIYRFEPCEPGEYAFRIDFLNHPTWHPASREYFSFLEEMGIQVVGKWLFWIALKKRTADGPLDLYSDFESQIRHCQRVVRWFTVIAVIEMIAVLMMLPEFIFLHLMEHHPFFDCHSFFLILVFLFLFLLFRLRQKVRRRELRYRKEQQIHET